MGSPTYQNDNVDFLHNIQQTSSLTSETDQDDVTYGDISDESRKVRKRLE